MTDLRTDPNIADPDTFYTELVALHDGLSEEESISLNARLVLILANQIGDLSILRQVLVAAKASGRKNAT